MYDVFVSYARADRPRAERIVQSLERRGLSVFWDRKIPAGTTWDQVLEKQLSSVRCVLVLWTKESIESDWVKTEAAEARRSNKLVPVLLDDVPPPLEFRRIQTARLVDWSGNDDDPELTGLVEAISALVGRAPSVPVDGDRKSLRVPWRIAAAAVILTIAGLLLWYALSSDSEAHLQLVTADGLCPPGLPNTSLTATLGSDSTDGVIDKECRFPLPAAAASGDLNQLELALDAGAQFILDSQPRQIPENFPDAPLKVFVAAKHDSPRVEIAMFSYSGLSDEGPRKTAFAEFRGILEDKLTNLVQELAINPELTQGPAAGQLARLKLRTLQSSQSAGLDLAEKLRIWRQRHSLGLLSGTLSREAADDGARFRVDSQIFIGDLDGATLGRSIPLAMEIGAEEFRNTRDAHALTVLYALALDARRLEFPDNVVTVYLSKAYSIARSLRESASDRSLVESVSAIGTRVEEELSDLAKRSRRP